MSSISSVLTTSLIDTLSSSIADTYTTTNANGESKTVVIEKTSSGGYEAHISGESSTISAGSEIEAKSKISVLA